MSLKYEFDVDDHSVRCIGTARGSVWRNLEMLYHAIPPTQGLGWNYIGGGTVTALVDAEMSRDVAVQRLEILHDDMRDNGIRKREFDRVDRDERTKSKFKPPTSVYHLGYEQHHLAEPVSLISQNLANEVVIEQHPLYWGKCTQHYIEHIPFITPYEAAVAIGRDASVVTVLRRMRRFIRHVERNGLGECNVYPPLPARELSAVGR